MANSISYAIAYLNMLDQIFKETSMSSVFETPATQYKVSTQAENIVYLKEMSVNGLGTYSKTNGYVAGDTTISWRAYQLTQDRGRKYTIDTVDAMEARTTAMEIMAEVMRTQVVPEVDAYRFSKICSLCSVDATGTLTVDTVVNAIDTAIQTLDDAEVPKVGRVLFISNAVNTLLKNAGDTLSMRYLQANNGVMNRIVTQFDDMNIIVVPVTRFKTAFTFYDGTTGGQEAGGFVAAGGAKEINFMIATPAMVSAIIKHNPMKLISPELNQSSDGWLMATRLYHDLLIPQNKLSSVYIHTKA
jgi:hypothetical protein